MKQIKRFMFAIFVGSFIFVGSGCSVYGFGIGAFLDSKEVKEMEFPVEQISSIPMKSKIKIFLKN